MAVDADRRDCPDAALLAAFAERNVTPAEKSGLAEHFDSCAECRGVWFETMLARWDDAVEPRTASPVRTVAAVLLAAALVVLAVRVFGDKAGNPPRSPEFEQLVAAVDQERTRPSEGRLTGGFVYAAPPSLVRAASDANRNETPRVRVALAAIERAAREHPSVDRTIALGIAYLFDGEPERAVAILEQVRAERPEDGHVASDLAAAYLARAARGGSEADYRQALRAAERGLQLEPTLAEAAFNRAAALEGLGQVADAAAAWRTAAVLDRGTQWSAEAERRATALDSSR